jgi:uncharacterized protein
VNYHPGPDGPIETDAAFIVYMTRYEKASEYIIRRLREELSPQFHYHNIDHVLDVLSSAEQLGREEGISETEMELLRVSALYHDSGFLIRPENHEVSGCDLVKQILPGMGYSTAEIEIICGMIMATKIPQSPSTHLERIICDADLDYLGRNDFFDTGNKVYRELKEFGVIQDTQEWNSLQVSFLSSHNYFTETAIRLRKSAKLRNLEEVKKQLGAG